MTIGLIWLVSFGLLAGIGALLDAFTRKLPNVLCGVMLLAGLGLAFAASGWSGLGLHAAHAALGLAFGYLMFVWGVFGGGDGKFYAATAAFFPVTQALGMFASIALAGFVLAVVWFTAKRALHLGPRLEGDFAKLPYGVAIAAGALGFALLVAR